MGGARVDRRLDIGPGGCRRNSRSMPSSSVSRPPSCRAIASVFDPRYERGDPVTTDRVHGARPRPWLPTWTRGTLRPPRRRVPRQAGGASSTRLPPARMTILPSGSNSAGRVSASQAECRGFESRLPLQVLPPTARYPDGTSSMERDNPAYGGQSEYTPFFLKIYDPVVLGFFTRVVWRCPTPRLVERYRRHIRPRHLDVGPGTGYFLERSGLPEGSPVTLLDPNTNVLDHATRRLRRLDITAVEADVCKPLPITGPFDSAALNGVIHCLPGPLIRKAGAIANVAAVVAPTGVFFGATILGTSGPHTRLARMFLNANNRRGTFDNLGDTEEGLRETSGHRSNGWRSRPSAHSRSSRPRIRARTRPTRSLDVAGRDRTSWPIRSGTSSGTTGRSRRPSGRVWPRAASTSPRMP